MRFVSVRELRNTPSDVWAALRSHDLVLTNNGDPVAVIARLEGGDAEATLLAIRRARAQQSVSSLRDAARRGGIADLSDAEIEAEVRATREARSGD
jgi:antitoxin (DNA-binding transcriptional repressor) of toxin-antitoxin stability system